VYLAYSLYNLGRRDDVLALASKYEQALPKEPNFPLLEGHVHRQGQLLDQAVDDYTRAIERDPKMVEAYVNRGYVYNDMQNAEAALQDFDKALALQPKNGIAQLGRSFSNLEMRRAAPALDNAQAAKNLMGDSGAVELALATAYRQQRRLRDAETHYHAALGYAPNDITLWLALADTQYQARQYNDSIASLNQALQLDAHDPLIYAEMAHSYAKMKQKDNTYNAIKQAEQEGSDQSAVLLATGDALLTLGDRDAAMERYGRAMRAPDANRIDVRLALARVFASQGKYDDARQQISLGFADARVGESSPASAENLIEAGNLFLGMHEYNLAFNFYDRARQAGAPEDAVALGEANTYLAQGDDRHAEAALALMGNPQDNTDNYDYQIALGEFYRQKRDLAHAMAAFGRANRMSTDPTDFRTEDSLLQTAGEHGYNLTHDLTVASDTSFAPIFEDTTIYALDAKLVTNGTTALPGPRSTFESRETTAFRYTPNGLPPITAIWQLRDAVGRQSFPSINRVVDRNTLDTSFGAGLSPEVHLGAERIMFNGGVQFTLRRDKRDPLDINENLFRQYLYAETSPLFDWITVRANGFHESGPFTLRNLNSREFGGRVEFQVGRPWAKTFLVTGYTVDDLTFRPLIREYFTTSTYAGLQHKFGDRLTVTGLAELIRSWRVQDIQFATAQAIAPGANVDARLTRSLSLNAFGTWQSNKTIGAFDNVQSGFFISYTRPLSQVVNDGLGAVRIEFPLRISLGLQQESFMHLTGTTGSNTIIRPVIRVTIF
jgi:tetratricopeptide (TPR) repeat protein